MPRQAFSIQQVHIADGFADDCDELIHRCSRVDVLTYHAFCLHYKEMNFASIYQGRTSNAEIAELSEEVIQIAKYYMVLDTSNFEESVAGLFLVYSLLNLQPYPRFASLRLVPEDMPAVDRIQRVARRDRRLDVLYILGSVLIRGPVQYHADNRPRGMERSIRKNLENFHNIDVTGVRPKGVYFRQNEELDIIRDVSAITKRYASAKKHLKASRERNLNYINENLAEELSTSLKKVIDGTADETGETSVEPESKVKEIKNRAMQNTVGVVRHLDSANMRSPEKKKQQETEPTTPSKFSTAKQSPKRRPQKPKTPPKRKRRRKSYSSTSSSSSENTEDNDNLCVEYEGSLAEIDKNDEQVINVEIDSLPSLITTESGGKTFEIEIIDEMKEKGKSQKASKRGNQINNNEVHKNDLTNKDLAKMTKEDELKKGEEKSIKDTGNKGDDSKKGDKMVTDDLVKKGAGFLKGDNIKKKGTSSKGNETNRKGNKKAREEKTKKVEEIGKEDEVPKKDNINEGNNNTPKPDEAKKDAKRKRNKLTHVDESNKSKETTNKDEMKAVETDGNNTSEEDVNKSVEIEKGDKKANKKRGRPKKEENSDEETFKRPLRSSPRLKQLSRRELKKTILKSKFKKMGMLEVANFEAKD